MSLRWLPMRSVFQLNYAVHDSTPTSIARQMSQRLSQFYTADADKVRWVFDLWTRTNPQDASKTQVLAARGTLHVPVGIWLQADAWEVVTHFDDIKTSALTEIMEAFCPMIPNHNGYGTWPVSLSWPKTSEWIVLSLDKYDLGDPTAVFAQQPPTPPRPLTLAQIFDSTENQSASIRRHCNPEEAIGTCPDILAYQQKCLAYSFLFALHGPDTKSAHSDH